MGDGILETDAPVCSVDHGCRIYSRLCTEPVAWAWHMGLQQYALEYSWTDMPAVHIAVVLCFRSGNHS